MTARVVIYSTLTARPNYSPRQHAESPECPGVPICGTNLRNWTRAVAVDDRGLCDACWPAVSNAENAWDSGRIRATTKATPAVFAHCYSGALPTTKESTDG